MTDLFSNARARRFALSVLCEDEVGLVARILQALQGLSVEPEALHQEVIHGCFSIQLLLSAPQPISSDELRYALHELTQLPDFVMSILPRSDLDSQIESGVSMVLALQGKKKPGILSAVTQYLSDRSINIENMVTRAESADEFSLIAHLTLPGDLSPAAAQLDLREILSDDNLTIALMHKAVFTATHRID